MVAPSPAHWWCFTLQGGFWQYRPATKVKRKRASAQNTEKREEFLNQPANLGQFINFGKRLASSKYCKHNPSLYLRWSCTTDLAPDLSHEKPQMLMCPSFCSGAPEIVCSLWDYIGTKKCSMKKTLPKFCTWRIRVLWLLNASSYCLPESMKTCFYVLICPKRLVNSSPKLFSLRS